MALYAISDLHLSLSVDKPMDVFGKHWERYMERIKYNWEKEIVDDDYVLIPGDVSWATYLEQIYEDFNFINQLPGIKIISKGNHDYWWSTVSKLEKYVKENNFNTIRFLHNNSFTYKDAVICGTRGWNCPGDEQFSQEDEKIYNRELVRLELSLNQGIKNSFKEIIVALHYPPVNKDKDMASGFMQLLKKYNVNTCIYGHLHGEAQKDALIGMHEGIQFYLVASDYMNFSPLKLKD